MELRATRWRAFRGTSAPPFRGLSFRYHLSRVQKRHQRAGRAGRTDAVRVELPGPAQDAGFMATALEEARAAIAHEDVPIGAAIVRDGKVIARARNRREEASDPTGHAEILALREAGKRLGAWRLTDCVLYVTLEPCVMC